MGVTGGPEHAISEHELFIAVPRLLIRENESIESFFVSNVVEFAVVRRIDILDWLDFFQWAEASCWMCDLDGVSLIADRSFEHAEETGFVESDLQTYFWAVETHANNRV